MITNNDQAESSWHQSSRALHHQMAEFQTEEQKNIVICYEISIAGCAEKYTTFIIASCSNCTVFIVTFIGNGLLKYLDVTNGCTLTLNMLLMVNENRIDRRHFFSVLVISRYNLEEI